LKKSVIAITLGLSISVTGLVSGASAATVKNGVACAKSGASTTVKVKGVSKAYICKINPSVTGATKPTWTLKTCITYWAAAMASQKSIDDQLALVKVMSEPDKTTYTNQLADSQLALNKVKASIVSNHCQAGL
jgi:hypothetical protein